MAARVVLAEKGYRGLSYSSVASAAHVDKGTIRYNFGNKAALVAAIVDSLIHDECVALAEELDGLSGEERIHHAVAGLRRIVLAGDSQRGWFDILPHALREKELRRRICGLYEWWLQLNLQWLDLTTTDGANARTAAGVASLFAAVSDGLALQVSLGLDIDLDASFDALELMLECTFSRSGNS
jgi:AcrR family transcriptional regulator